MTGGLETNLAELTRDGAASRVRAARQRIASHPRRRHAFISLDPTPADVAPPASGPLAGAVFSVKDNIDVAGVTTTCGSRVLEHASPARDDAAITASLRALGGTCVGKNNMHEFALGATGTNDRFGPMPNPWDISRHVGGSSGGSVIAVADGMVDLAVGTDSGGSVRMPASFGGIVGFKPTSGVLPMDGVVGASWSIDCLGLMTRTAADMAFVWQALGPPPSRPSRARPRIAYLMDESMGRVAPKVWEGYLAAIARLRAADFDLTGVSLPGLEPCPRLCISIVYPEVASSQYEMMRTSPHLYEPDVRALVALGEIWSARNYVDAQRARTVMRDRVEEVIAPFDLLLTPTVALQAPHFGETPRIEGDPPGSALFPIMRFTVPFNVISYPGLSVPAGLDSDGLPVGLQVVGRPNDDAAVVQTAVAIERVLGRLTLPGAVAVP